MEKIDFFDRKYNTVTAVIKPELITDKRLKQEQVTDKKTKRIVRKSKFVAITRKDEMKNYRASDFALENMIAVGASLEPTKLVGNKFNQVHNIESSLSKLSNQMNNNNE